MANEDTLTGFAEIVEEVAGVPAADVTAGYAVIVTVGEGGEAVMVDGLPDLVGLLGELAPAVKHVSDLSGGATSALEREYARLRKLGYPHEVADAASRAYAAEVEDEDDEVDDEV